ncbi:MAG: DUF488 domain-containing protein [Gammaproteobacteria bacterium]|nr:MAG: DUF488 domain-containing protein [Gammaproteobacteria bacterium]
MKIRIKRVYEPPAKADGLRILVDRLWPRGLSKQNAKIDHWFRDIAPSGRLRKWFTHDPAKWDEFRKRYARELDGDPEAVAGLRRLLSKHRATLLFAAKDTEHNNAAVLRDYLARRRPVKKAG